MKFKCFFAVLLAWVAMAAQAQTLSLGNYDDLQPYGDPSDFSNLYDGSYWEVAPINYYLANSGAQIIYRKDEIPQLAGKLITGFSFPWMALDAFIDATRDVKIYLTETSADEFYRNDDNRIYRYFDLNWAEPLFEGPLCPEVMLYAYCIGEPINIQLQKPYYYSGESSLVLTVIAENGEECTNGGFYVNFFTIPDTKKHALPFASDFITFQSVLFGDRWCEGAHISPIESPVVQIAYEEGNQLQPMWRSYVPAEDVDLNIGGFDAFKMSDYTSNSVRLEKVSSAPKGTPLLVRSVVYPSIIATKAPAMVTNNMLMLSDGSVSGGNNIFAVGEKDGVQGFVRLLEGQFVPEGEIYFKGAVDTDDFLPFEAALGINAPKARQTDGGAWFRTDGSRTEKPLQKGVYIHNGKKTVVK